MNDDSDAWTEPDPNRDHCILYGNRQAPAGAAFVRRKDPPKLADAVDRLIFCARMLRKTGSATTAGMAPFNSYCCWMQIERTACNRRSSGAAMAIVANDQRSHSMRARPVAAPTADNDPMHPRGCRRHVVIRPDPPGDFRIA